MKRSNHRRTSALGLENLERRDLFTTMAYFPWANGNDDTVVVAKNSTEREIDVLANDSGGWTPWYTPGVLVAEPLILFNDREAGDFVVRPSDGIHSDYIVSPPPLNFVSVTQPAHGSVRWDAAEKNVKLTTEVGYVGTDYFTYTARQGNSEYTATVYLNVVDPLVAMPDWVRVDQESVDHEIDVLGNDYLLDDPDNSGPLTITEVTTSTPGVSLAISDDGTRIHYRAADGFTGQDTLQYTVRDGAGNLSTAEVTIEVTAAAEPASDAFRSAEEFEHFLLNLVLEQSRHQLGQRTNGWGGGHYPFLASDTWRQGSLQLATLEVQTDATTALFSTADRQVAGVDEADMVKTDGQLLYVVSNTSANGGELLIVDIRDRLDPKVGGSIQFEGRVHDLLLMNNRIVVMSDVSQDSSSTSYSRDQFMVSVLDVTDVTQPSVIEEIAIEGRYDQSRAVGSFVYLVSGFDVPTMLDLSTECDTLNGREICFYESARQLADRFAAEGLGHLIAPTIVTTHGDDTQVTRQAMGFEGFRKSEFQQGRYGQTTVITSFDISRDQDMLRDVEYARTGWSTEIYVSLESIYLMDTDWSATTIRKYAMTEGAADVEFAASGTVDGQLLNRFSVDEFDGYFRLATTDQSDFPGKVDLYVLQQHGDTFDTVGMVENLAPGEQVYATRFMGDTAFVVTFRQVDPFFVIDLSDATNPQVVGELKVPGYSQYLQIIDENHVLGIGRNADEQSGLYEGMQVSIFDVTVKSDPQLIDRYDFEGGRSTWSPLARGARDITDPHAVTYLPDTGLLALPIYSEDWGWGSLSGVDNTPIFSDPRESAIRILQIDTTAGITSLGQIPFDTHASRTVRIDDYWFGISEETIKVTGLTAPDTVLAELSVGTGDESTQDYGDLIRVLVDPIPWEGMPVVVVSDETIEVNVVEDQLGTDSESAPKVATVATRNEYWASFGNLIENRQRRRGERSSVEQNEEGSRNSAQIAAQAAVEQIYAERLRTRDRLFAQLRRR